MSVHPFCIYNFKILPIENTYLSVLDRGFLLGDGLFETIRAYSGDLPFWHPHIERLKASMEQLGYSFRGIDFDRMYIMARQLLEKNSAYNAYVRLTLSRGKLESGLMPEWGKGKANSLVFTKPLPSNLEEIQRKGLKVIISSVRRNNFSPTTPIKTVNYVDMILAKREAFLKGAQDCILLDINGFVTEATTSNIFWVKGSTLYTPSVNLPILPGITRQKILEIACHRLGIHSEEGRYTPDDLIGCEEAFMTNSISEVIPIVNINGRQIHNGISGEITMGLHSEYKSEIYKVISGDL